MTYAAAVHWRSLFHALNLDKCMTCLCLIT